MPLAFNSPQRVATVSNAGAIGFIGTAGMQPDEIHACAESIRKLTNAPSAFNSLTFLEYERGLCAVVRFRTA